MVSCLGTVSGSIIIGSSSQRLAHSESHSHTHTHRSESARETTKKVPDMTVHNKTCATCWRSGYDSGIERAPKHIDLMKQTRPRGRAAALTAAGSEAVKGGVGSKTVNGLICKFARRRSPVCPGRLKLHS